MKKTKSNLKLITLLLSSVFLFQSCKTFYKSQTVTVDEAIKFPGKIKIKTNTKNTYKFESLRKEDSQLYGIAKRNSSTAKKLIDQVIKENPTNKYVKIVLNEDLVNKIYVEDKTGSLIQNALFIGALGVVALGLLVLVAFSGGI